MISKLKKKRTDIVGVILAGGKSSRMGSDKALLMLRGKPFIQLIAHTLQNVFEKVIVISDHVESYKFLELPVYRDIYEDCGPLGGIQTAFARTKTGRVLIVPCDMPLITAKDVRSLLEVPLNADVVVVPSGKSIQPLFGLYSRRCVPALEKRLKRGQYSVLDLLGELPSVSVVPRVIACNLGGNINTPAAYKKVQRLVEAKHLRQRQRSPTDY